MDLSIGISQASTASSASRGKATVWAGRALTGLALLFLAFDSVGKLLVLPPVVQATTQLGYPAAAIRGIGVVLAVCTLLYAVPRTAVLGAVLLTGYLGGAVASNVRVSAPLASHTLFPVYFAVVLWLALYLRDDRVRALVRMRR